MPIRKVRSILGRCKRLITGQKPWAPTPIPDALSEEMVRLNEAAGARAGVEPAVHEKDFIYWYGVCDFGPEVGVEGYFVDGAKSADQLDRLVAGLGRERCRLLEFAAGYGRVTRHLKRRPRFDVTASDIHPAANEFVRDRLGVPAVPSTAVPEDFRPAGQWDVVFALSFFSHLPKASFGRWLRALFGAVAPGGYLVFTTHGQKVRRVVDNMPADGFYFEAKSEQADLEKAEYGTAIVTPDYVIGELYRQSDGAATLVSLEQGGWWGVQDVWVAQRR